MFLKEPTVAPQEILKKEILVVIHDKTQDDSEGPEQTLYRFDPEYTAEAGKIGDLFHAVVRGYYRHLLEARPIAIVMEQVDHSWLLNEYLPHVRVVDMDEDIELAEGGFVKGSTFVEIDFIDNPMSYGNRANAVLGYLEGLFNAGDISSLYATMDTETVFEDLAKEFYNKGAILMPSGVVEEESLILILPMTNTPNYICVAPATIAFNNQDNACPLFLKFVDDPDEGQAPFLPIKLSTALSKFGDINVTGFVANGINTNPVRLTFNEVPVEEDATT